MKRWWMRDTAVMNVSLPFVLHFLKISITYLGKKQATFSVGRWMPSQEAAGASEDALHSAAQLER